MKKLILITALIGIASAAMAQQVNVTRESLGSGQPASLGNEQATQWDNNIYHAPQYMPGNPTAASLYPRVVDVQCTKSAGNLNCKGYNWMPEMGRGEYLMIRPTVVTPVEPKSVVVTKTVEVIRNVYVEVPVKKKKE